MMKKISYQLDIKAKMCHAQVRVNDVEVFSREVSGSMRVEHPINLYILESGPHEINVRCLPLSGDSFLHPDAQIRYAVQVFEEGSEGKELEEEMEEHTTPVINEGDTSSSHKSTFMAEVPYKVDGWQTGVDLTAADFDVRSKLFSTYRKLHFYLKTGNFAKYFEAIRKNQEQIAKAVYRPEEQVIKADNESFINDLSQGFEIAPIPEDAIMEFQAYGKLASLKQVNGKSALFFKNSKTGSTMYMVFKFYIPKGKTEFEVI